MTQINTKKTATAFSKEGSVSVMKWGADICILNYSTYNGGPDIGLPAQEEIFTALYKAAIKQLAAK